MDIISQDPAKAIGTKPTISIKNTNIAPLIDALYDSLRIDLLYSDNFPFIRDLFNYYMESIGINKELKLAATSLEDTLQKIDNEGIKLNTNTGIVSNFTPQQKQSVLSKLERILRIFEMLKTNKFDRLYNETIRLQIESQERTYKIASVSFKYCLKILNEFLPRLGTLIENIKKQEPNTSEAPEAESNLPGQTEITVEEGESEEEEGEEEVGKVKKPQVKTPTTTTPTKTPNIQELLGMAKKKLEEEKQATPAEEGVKPATPPAPRSKYDDIDL